MHTNISNSYTCVDAENELRNRISASHGKHPQVSAFADALLDDSPSNKELSGTIQVFYSILDHDAIEMATIGLSELLDKRGTRTDFLLFTNRLGAALQTLGQAVGISADKRAWTFPPQTASALREIAKTLRSGQHA